MRSNRHHFSFSCRIPALSIIVLAALFSALESYSQCSDITFEPSSSPATTCTSCEFEVRVANHNIEGGMWIYAASWVKIDAQGGETPIVDSGPTDGVSFSSISLIPNGTIENGILRIVLNSYAKIGVRIVKKDIDGQTICTTARQNINVNGTSYPGPGPGPGPAVPTLQQSTHNICHVKFIEETVTFNVTGPSESSFTWSELWNSSPATPITSPSLKYTLGNNGTSLTLNLHYFIIPDEFTLENGKLTKKFQVCNGGGCANASVILEPLPTILPFTPLTSCENSERIVLNDAVPSGGQWSGYGVEDGAFNPAITGPGSFTITYSYTDPVNQCVNRQTRDVTINPTPVSPIVSDKSVMVNTSTILTASGAVYGETYRWYSESGSFLGQGESFNTPLMASETKFLVRKTNITTQCESEAATITVSVLINNYNYIIEDIITKPDEEDVNSIDELTHSQRIRTISYFDGLGRIMQTIAQQSSPLARDIISPVIYDPFGRNPITYLPFVDEQANGYYRLNSVGDGDPEGTYSSSPQAMFYQNNETIAKDSNPFAKTEYEQSPLNRVLKQGGPGAIWQPSNDPSTDRSVKSAYRFNLDEEVMLFQYDASNETLSPGGEYYSPNRLVANETIDEHNNIVIEFVDKEGRTVCKKVQYGNNESAILFAETYYIYDDFGNLVMVLPPEAVKALTSE